MKPPGEPVEWKLASAAFDRRGPGGLSRWLPANTVSFNLLLSLAFCFSMAGCRPASPPEASSPQKPEAVSVNKEPVRRALGNIESYLSDLEGRLRISNAQTWRLQAAAAQGDVGNIRSAIGTLKAASRNLGSLESLLSDLEGKLRGASADNWNQDVSAAQQILGSIQIELQNLRRGL
jgi:hypothetical protein